MLGPAMSTLGTTYPMEARSARGPPSMSGVSLSHERYGDNLVRLPRVLSRYKALGVVMVSAGLIVHVLVARDCMSTWVPPRNRCSSRRIIGTLSFMPSHSIPDPVDGRCVGSPERAKWRSLPQSRLASCQGCRALLERHGARRTRHWPEFATEEMLHAWRGRGQHRSHPASSKDKPR